MTIKRIPIQDSRGSVQFVPGAIIYLFIYKRVFSDENKMHFLNYLAQIDWIDIVDLNNNVNEQWNSFINTFVNIGNDYYPLKLVNTDRKTKNNLAHREDIKLCKNKLDLLLSLYRIDASYKDRYNKTKKEYDSLLK